MYMSPLVMLSCCLHVFRAFGSVFMFVFVSSGYTITSNTHLLKSSSL